MHELGLYLYIALVTGPFGNLSSDFSLLVDFIARERAMQTIKLRSAIQLSRLRFIAVLWCGASAFSPLVAGLSIFSTAGTTQCQTAPQHPIPLNSVLQLMSFFLTTRTVAATTACTCLVLKASGTPFFFSYACFIQLELLHWESAKSGPTASHTTEIDLAADEFRSDNPHRGGYHGMHVPGAYSTGA